MHEWVKQRKLTGRSIWSRDLKGREQSARYGGPPKGAESRESTAGHTGTKEQHVQRPGGSVTQPQKGEPGKTGQEKARDGRGTRPHRARG